LGVFLSVQLVAAADVGNSLHPASAPAAEEKRFGRFLGALMNVNMDALEHLAKVG